MADSNLADLRRVACSVFDLVKVFRRRLLECDPSELAADVDAFGELLRVEIDRVQPLFNVGIDDVEQAAVVEQMPPFRLFDDDYNTATGAAIQLAGRLSLTLTCKGVEGVMEELRALEDFDFDVAVNRVQEEWKAAIRLLNGVPRRQTLSPPTGPQQICDQSTVFEAKESTDVGAVLNKIALAAGEEGAKIFAIASDRKVSSSDRMERICDVDPKYLAWTAPKWASLLGVSDAAIRKAPFWKVERKRRCEAARRIWLENNPDCELPEELASIET